MPVRGELDRCNRVVGGEPDPITSHQGQLLEDPLVGRGQVDSLHSSTFAPVNGSWGLENRSVAIRVKGLVGATAIAAGLDRIRNHIEPPPATEGLAYGLQDGPRPSPPAWRPPSTSWRRTPSCTGSWARS